ncbi:hypothetical protein ACHAWF_016958 [Thalassiosira exigua]
MSGVSGGSPTRARGGRIRAGNAGTTTIICNRAPRRMFLCDVPIFAKRIDKVSGDGNNLVRVMGTVVDVLPSSDVGGDSSLCETSLATSSSADGEPSHQTRLVHFVIDDGTGCIGVFARRKMARNGDYATKRNHGECINQSSAMMALESILSSLPPSISVGQAVDCIGRIQVECAGELGVHRSKEDCLKQSASHHGLWLAASSVSITRNPQDSTLRQIELSSKKRLKRASKNSSHCGPERGTTLPQNRILAGGELERKLNPLFRCSGQRSVAFDLETAFNYIKHSKDDGGITPKEMALLVGAVEPNEILAVNLSIEQLREDCRIYLNQGKWFPM